MNRRMGSLAAHTFGGRRLSIAVFGLVLITHIAGAVVLDDLRAHPQRASPPEPMVVTFVEVAESVSSADAAAQPAADEPVQPAARPDPPKPTRNLSWIPTPPEQPAPPHIEDLGPVPPQPQPHVEPIVPERPVPQPETRPEPAVQPAPPPAPPAATPPSTSLAAAGMPDPPGRPASPEAPSPPAAVGTQAVAAAPTGVPPSASEARPASPRFDVAYLDNPKPAYPLSARRMQLEGTVRLRVFVNAAGRAEQVELQATSGSPVLDRSAMDAVRRWRFVPARRGEEAVPAWVIVPIVFTLNG